MSTKNKIILISLVILCILSVLLYFIFNIKKENTTSNNKTTNLYTNTINSHANDNTYSRDIQESPINNRFIVTNTQTQTPTQPAFVPNTITETQNPVFATQNNTPIPETPEQIEIKNYTNIAGLMLNDIQQGLFSYIEDLSAFATSTPPKSGDALGPIIGIYDTAIENIKDTVYPEILKNNHEALLSSVIATKEALSSIANNPSGNNANSWIKINESTLNIAKNILEISDKINLYRINFGPQDPGILFLDVGSR